MTYIYDIHHIRNSFILLLTIDVPNENFCILEETASTYNRTNYTLSKLYNTYKNFKKFKEIKCK